jgi:hypothetical protein
MTSESDKGEQQEHVVVAQYQDLLAKLSPDEAFFEMANSPIVSFRIDSSSTVSDEVIRVEQKQELENSCWRHCLGIRVRTGRVFEKARFEESETEDRDKRLHRLRRRDWIFRYLGS